MTVQWRQFVMDLDALDPATVEDLFSQLGACSVTLSDAGDEPVLEPGPGETPLWSNTRVTGLFFGLLAECVDRGIVTKDLPTARGSANG